MKYTRDQLDALASASAERLLFPENIERELRVGGEDYSGSVESLVYGVEDGIAVVLEAVLSVPLPPSVEGKRCRVDWIVYPSGEALPGYRGKVLEVRVRGSKTTLTAATGGYEIGATPVGDPGEDREYNGTAPDAVLYDLLSVLAHEYDGIEIPRKGKPLIRMQDAERVFWTQMLSDPVQAVAERAKLIAADLPINIGSAYRLGAPDQAKDAAWTFEEGLDTEPEGISVETVAERRYARVIVWAASPSSGEHIPLTEPIEVDNKGGYVNPRSTLLVELTADLVAEGKTAYELGRSEAIRVGRNEARVAISPKYPPFFLARGDTVIAIKKTPVAEGVVVSTYRVVLDAAPVENLGGTPAGNGVLIRERTEEVAQLQEFDRKTGSSRPLWGTKPNGRDGFFDTSLPWVSEDENGEEIILDTQLASQYNVNIYTDPSDAEAVVIEYI